MDELKISWDDITCKLIRKKCHYHNNIKIPYDTMTSNYLVYVYNDTTYIMSFFHV